MVGVSHTATKWFLVLTTSLTLTACGGGGGGGSRSADTLPDVFEPDASQTGATLGDVVTFTAFEVTGIDAEVPITISDGLYAIGDTDFTDSAGEVSEGDTVTVQVTASDMFSTETNATLRIGSGSATFTVESEAEDTNPEAFELGDAVTVNTAEEQAETTAFTVSGINSPANISIANGEYRIGETGTYTTEDGTVALGESVQVRVTASTTAPSDEIATLTIGDQSDTFTVSTADTTTPQAQVIFPTPATLTDGTSITLRGTATDDFGPVASIRVTVTTDDGATEVGSDTLEATDDDDFSNTWSFNVNLGSEKLNTVTVEAIDAAGNVQAEPTVVTLLQAADALNTNFPEGNEVFIGEISFGGVVLDEVNSRMLMNGNSSRDIVAVDLNTGNRTLFLENPNSVRQLGGFQILPDTNELVVTEVNEGVLHKSPLDSPEFTLLTDPTFEGIGGNVVFPSGLRFDVISGKLLVADIDSQIVSIDPVTGVQEVISDNTINPDEPMLLTPSDLVVNNSNSSLLVLNTDLNDPSSSGSAVIVSIVDGERSNVDVQQGADFGQAFGIEWLVQDEIALISSQSTEGLNEPGRILMLDLEQSLLTDIATNGIPEGAANNIQVPQFLSVDQDQELAFVVTGGGFADARSSILVLDTTTGERVVLTRSVVTSLQ